MIYTEMLSNVCFRIVSVKADIIVICEHKGL